MSLFYFTHSENTLLLWMVLVWKSLGWGFGNWSGFLHRLPCYLPPFVQSIQEKIRWMSADEYTQIRWILSFDQNKSLTTYHCIELRKSRAKERASQSKFNYGIIPFGDSFDLPAVRFANLLWTIQPSDLMTIHMQSVISETQNCVNSLACLNVFSRWFYPHTRTLPCQKVRSICEEAPA